MSAVLMDSGESSSNGVASSKPRSGRSNDKKTGRNLAVKQQPTAEIATPDIAHQLPEILQDCLTDASQSVAKHNAEADLSELHQLVRAQQDEINVLQQQPEFVLSFLDIKETDVIRPIMADLFEQSVPNHWDVDDGGVGTCRASLWSEVVTRHRRPPRQQSNEGSTQPTGDGSSVLVRLTPRLAPPQTLQQSMLTAVYNDQSSQKRR